jgi:hypothetical protein
LRRTGKPRNIINRQRSSRQVQQTAGHPPAKADRAGEGLTGTWKEEGGAAVMRWDTGWTTKITKEGDKYKKTAYDKGKPLDGPPTNSSDAEKVG